jgi:P4 family phage/plasmid primase-like protien
MNSITNLLSHHADQLRASGLIDATIAASGIESETRIARLRLLLNWPKMPARLASGLLFRFRDFTGELNGYYRFKPDSPRKDRNEKPIKYESPRGTPNRAYFPPGTVAALTEPSAELLVTEGEKKSLAADQAGFPCVGLVGVFGWKAAKAERLIPDLELIEWRGRQVRIVFDSDLADNENVADAESRLAAQLSNRGAIVRVVRLPSGTHGEKMGLDDFLVAHGRVELRKRLDAAQEPDAVDSGTAKADARAIDAMPEARRFLVATASHKEGGETLLRLRYWRGAYWWWTGTHYREEAADDVRAKLVSNLDTAFFRLSKSAVANVLLCLESETNVGSHREMPSWLDITPAGNWIALKNGILDISGLLAGKPDILIPHTPRFFAANVLPFDFDLTATCPRWLSFLDRNLEGDAERIAILQEFYGYCLTPTLTAHKFLFLEGDGANGKSVACAVLTALLGPENVSAVPLEQFGERFALWPTSGKLANVASEIGEIDRVAEGILKQYTSGDAMQFDRKHRDPITARPTAKLIFASNNRPRFSDKSGGLWRRMILMPWRVVIPEGERVRGLDTPQWWQDQGELPGVLLWAIAGLHRLQQQSGFTRSEVCDAALSEYRAESNPARLFLDERYRFDPNSYTPCDEVYRQYHDWAKCSGYSPLSAISFGREIYRAFPNVDRREKLSAGERFTAYCGLAARD